MGRSGVPNSFVGAWGERIFAAVAPQVIGEPVCPVTRSAGAAREPVDFVSATYAIEVKTLLAGGEEKIRSAAKAVREKQAYAALVGKAPLSVLIVLDPATWTARCYRADGFRAFRRGGMTACGEVAVKAILLGPEVPRA